MRVIKVFIGIVYLAVLLDLARREVELARLARHRRLFVLVGVDDRRLAEGAAEVLRGYAAAAGRATASIAMCPI